MMLRLFLLLLLLPGIPGLALAEPLATPGMAVAEPVCRQDDLRIAVIPKKSMEVLIEEYRPLLKHLSKGLNLPVEFVRAESYDSVTDAIVSGGVDIAWIGPAGYLLANLRNPKVEAFANLTLEKGHFTPAGNYYQALLVVSADRNYKTVADLKNARVAFTDPLSTSGSLIPNHSFAQSVKTPLNQFFGAQVYTGSHDRSIEAVLAGRVDAAFIASVRADDFIRQEKMSPEALRVLWRSEAIHYDPFVFGPTVCAEHKAKIKQLMLEDQGPLNAFFLSQQATGLVAADHSDYAPMNKVMGGQAAN